MATNQATNQNTPKYFGNAIDINLAKQRGVQGEFFDTTKSNQGALLQTLKNAYDRGHNPVMLGGNKAQGGISQALEDQLKQSGYNSISRIGGADRNDSQQALARFDNNNKVNELYDQRKQAQLDQAKDLAPQYQAQRNQADVVNMQNMQKLREAMASNGLTKSGENVTGQIASNAQRQNALNDINISEQQANNEINRRAQEIEAERIQALIETGRYSDQQDFQYGRAKAEDARYNQQFNYQVGRDKVEDSRYNEQFKYQQGQDAAARAWQNYQFGNLSASERANLEWQRQQYNNLSASEKASLDWSKQQFGNLSASEKANIDMQKQNLALQKAQFQSETEWRKHTFNNMSATERAQLDWAKKEFGENAAWKMFELEYTGEMQKAMANSQASMYAGGASGGSGSSMDFLP